MTLREHLGGEFGVTVEYVEDRTSVTFMAAEVVAVGDDGPLYLRADSGSSEDHADFDKAEPYVTGMVKWDGCSHYSIGTNGYLHLCEHREVKKLADALLAIHARCGALMAAAGQHIQGFYL